jgi:heat shock protein HtpX
VIVSEIVLGFLASLIVLWFSRRREFRADFGGAKLAGRSNMIAALEKLKAVHEPLPQQLAAFGIADGRIASGFARLRLSHPPIEERIAALRALSADMQ